MDSGEAARLGRIAAAVADPFAERGAVLREHGYDDETWSVAKASLALALSADPGLREAYRRAFEAPIATPAVTLGVGAASVPAVHVPMPAIAAARPETLPVSPRHVPSYLRADALPVPPGAPPAGFAASTAPSPQAPPPVEPRGAPFGGSGIPVAAVAAKPTAAPMSGTANVDSSIFRDRDSIPFAPSGEAPSRARRDQQIAADHILVARARMQPDMAAPPVQTDGVDETALGTAIKGPALPFGKRTHFAPSSASSKPVTPFQSVAPGLAAPSATPVTPSPSGGRTVVAQSLKRQSLPFRKSSGAPASPPIPGWDIGRYGRLCIDLVKNPKDEDAVLASNGISRDQRRALDRYWEERMMTEPELRLEWKRCCDARVDELARRGR